MAGRQKNTEFNYSWRPIINETKANVVLEKHTVQYNIQKNIQAKKKARGKVCKKRTKVESLK